MNKIIIEDFVNARKLALFDDDKLTKLIIEKKTNQGIVGDIYRGRVDKILKGMGACFVDIGQGQLAYMKIKKEEKISVGDRLMVQLKKESKGEKKPSLSLEIGLQGRYIVYIPSNDRISYSNKLSREEIKDIKIKIRKLEMGELDSGIIIRTEAKFASLKEFKEEYYRLKNTYHTLVDKFKMSFNPGLIKKSKSQLEVFIEDNLDEKLENIIYPTSMENDDAIDEERFDIRSLIKSYDRIYLNKLIKDENPSTFANYGVNAKLNTYLSNKVWLKNGSYIVIDKTEAMTVIDVNSGRYIGYSNYENTVYDVNMGLAEEIARQILMRDLSGIIIIDFIDMKSDKHKQDLIRVMNEHLDADDKNTKVHGFTSLGLMEVSRRRTSNIFEDYYYNKSSRDYYSANRLVDMVEERVIHYIFHEYKGGSDGGFKPRLSIDIDRQRYNLLIKEKKELLLKIEDKYGIELDFKIG